MNEITLHYILKATDGEKKMPCAQSTSTINDAAGLLLMCSNCRPKIKQKSDNKNPHAQKQQILNRMQTDERARSRAHKHRT